MQPPDVRDGFLADPEFYGGEPHPAYQWLHRHAPVHLTESPRFWTVSKHEDVRRVSQDDIRFSVEHGLVINDVVYRTPLIAGAFPTADGAELLATTDGPRHTILRRHAQPAFGLKRIAAMEPVVRAMVVELLDRVDDGVPFDFVQQIAGPLPLMVIRELVGFRDVDIHRMWRWTDELFKIGERASEDELRQVGANLADMYEYFDVQLAGHRDEPSDDVMSMLLGSDVAGDNLSVANLHMFLQIMLIAGNETTRNLLSGATRALVEHPAELAELQRDPSLATNATEEFLRYVTPSIGHVRTAMGAAVVRDVDIAAGDKVLVLYAAANRDAEVYADPDTLRVRRRFAGQHMAFGFGVHSCLGAPLARLESRVFFEELARRVKRIELAGEPVRLRSTFANGHASLPVTIWR